MPPGQAVAWSSRAALPEGRDCTGGGAQRSSSSRAASWPVGDRRTSALPQRPARTRAPAPLPSRLEPGTASCAGGGPVPPGAGASSCRRR
eukprot:2436706-Lingulodinium_polyedra.AAC.1